MTVWDHVRDLRTRFGATILITTHAMEEVDALCDRVAILHAGRLEKVGAPTDLKAEIGPGATLDDVFSRVAGGDLVAAGNYRDVRQSRLGAAELMLTGGESKFGLGNDGLILVATCAVLIAVAARMYPRMTA